MGTGGPKRKARAQRESSNLPPPAAAAAAAALRQERVKIAFRKFNAWPLRRGAKRIIQEDSGYPSVVTEKEKDQSMRNLIEREKMRTGENSQSLLLVSNQFAAADGVSACRVAFVDVFELCSRWSID